MAGFQYMPFEVGVYLADTMHLSTEEHGAYLLLLFNYWQTGKPLKDSNDRLANIARMSNERWTDVRPVLEELFQIRDERWFHKRVEQDLERVRNRIEQNRAAGKASAEKRLAGSDNGNGCSTGDGTGVQPNKEKLNKKKKRPKKTFAEDSIEFRLSLLLYELILEDDPDYKKPNLQNWARDMDYLIRIDKRNPELVEKVMRFARDLPFWKPNILSVPKFRKQFPVLFAQWKNAHGDTGDEDPHRGKKQFYHDDPI